MMITNTNVEFNKACVGGMLMLGDEKGRTSHLTERKTTLKIKH